MLDIVDPTVVGGAVAVALFFGIVICLALGRWLGHRAIAGRVQTNFKVWDLPTPGERPHDPLAMPDGSLWWSGQFANRLGRLDPATGEVNEWPSPSGPALRHGLHQRRRLVQRVFSQPNTIVRFDPKTETFQSWAIPGGGDIVRNMDVDRDGNPVMANSLVNQVGLIEIKGQ